MQQGTVRCSEEQHRAAQGTNSAGDVQRRGLAAQGTHSGRAGDAQGTRRGHAGDAQGTRRGRAGDAQRNAAQRMRAGARSGAGSRSARHHMRSRSGRGGAGGPGLTASRAKPVDVQFSSDFSGASFSGAGFPTMEPPHQIESSQTMEQDAYSCGLRQGGQPRLRPANGKGALF